MRPDVEDVEEEPELRPLRKGAGWPGRRVARMSKRSVECSVAKCAALSGSSECGRTLRKLRRSRDGGRR